MNNRGFLWEIHMKNKIILSALTLFTTANSSHVFAYDLPTVNLGMTSFLDGGLPAGPGWYSQTYFQHYDSDKLRDTSGQKLPLPKTDLNYQVIVEQLSYMSTYKPTAHSSLGLNLLIPYLSKISVDDGLNNQALKAKSGFGDLMIGPFLQFDPVMGEQGPKFVHRIELQINLPTGEYQQNRDINPGNNAFSFNPYWAATYWFNPKWTASTRAHYLYNFKNDDPTYGFGAADDIQAGQAVHINLASEYAVHDQIRLGLSGYYLKQLTDTKVDGVKVDGRKESVWAVGPGLMYSHSPKNHVVANAYFENDAKNRTEGDRFQIRYIHHF